MKLLVVSGTSGSGKSTALNLLEDLGYYCVDNLPVGLLSAFAAQMASATEHYYEYAAVGIDARNRPDELRRFPSIVGGLRDAGLDCEVIYLDADDNILLKRFSETRRKHPLTGADVPLVDAIKKERELLDPLATNAELYIDTSHTNLHQLRDLIRDRVGAKDTQTLSVLFESFGFKHGIPGDADFVFDVRALPNPYWDQQLRPYTGRDEPVVKFLEEQPEVADMFNDLCAFIGKWVPHFEAANRSYLTIAIGCTGGHHRSVYLAERLAEHFRAQLSNISVRHRELL